MGKRFLGIKGRHFVGKTHTLLRFIERNSGVKLGKKSTLAICSRNGKTIFVRTSSPNERDRENAITLLNRDLEFFEKIVKNCQLQSFVVLMALTQFKKDTTPQTIQEVRDKGYEYAEIIKESRDDDILEELENHPFFR
ncbi:MAG: hypothetical protein WC197_05530 [Candidatus Gastranaerophilaceae bacterium]